MAEENKLQEMIRTSLESIRTMVDANTVVGTPITTPSGTTIIPISKVSVGYASGGTDFHGKNAPDANFAGGGGTGLSVQPVCFLAVDAEGKVEMIPIGGKGTPDSVEKIANAIEKAPDILAKLKKLFKKNKKSPAEEDAEADATFEAVADAVEAAADAADKAVDAAEKTAEAAAAIREKIDNEEN